METSLAAASVQEASRCLSQPCGLKAVSEMRVFLSNPVRGELRSPLKTSLKKLQQFGHWEITHTHTMTSRFPCLQRNCLESNKTDQLSYNRHEDILEKNEEGNKD